MNPWESHRHSGWIFIREGKNRALNGQGCVPPIVKSNPDAHSLLKLATGSAAWFLAIVQRILTALATRYDKSILSFESFLNLVAVRLWLKSFVNAA